ncbi:hypothetical protein COCMIDRAFT_6628 [Bipolaris oryzae ATCC 44560]|uniref:Uncharacterized protein n=1 Tax=Bipolaris oryzae ATCC 44560 TaxID=930090 RepID=W6YX69_COCMI|nr:uncharacterized protein COCMIDRAFT_6628 [Bipolaris oryzae ATCC 44560]EUC43992.1 hypothetical protein COCMIDRAFT_6628 [Bipolaris oryzae ATCC 44560]
MHAPGPRQSVVQPGEPFLDENNNILGCPLHAWSVPPDAWAESIATVPRKGKRQARLMHVFSLSATCLGSAVAVGSRHGGMPMGMDMDMDMGIDFPKSLSKPSATISTD